MRGQGALAMNRPPPQSPVSAVNSPLARMQQSPVALQRYESDMQLLSTRRSQRKLKVPSPVCEGSPAASAACRQAESADPPLMLLDERLRLAEAASATPSRSSNSSSSGSHSPPSSAGSSANDSDDERSSSDDEEEADLSDADMSQAEESDGNGGVVAPLRARSSFAAQSAFLAEGCNSNVGVLQRVRRSGQRRRLQSRFSLEAYSSPCSSDVSPLQVPSVSSSPPFPAVQLGAAAAAGLDSEGWRPSLSLPPTFERDCGGSFSHVFDTWRQADASATLLSTLTDHQSPFLQPPPQFFSPALPSAASVDVDSGGEDERESKRRRGSDDFGSGALRSRVSTRHKSCAPLLPATADCTLAQAYSSFGALEGATLPAGGACSSSKSAALAAASSSSASAATSASSSSSSPPSALPPPVQPPLAAVVVPPSYLRSQAEAVDTASISRMTARLYGLAGEEYGHRTVGHACVSRAELRAAAALHADLLYGEVLPVGATKLFDSEHLHLRAASTLCDLGSGLGKLALQAFLQFPNLRRVFGCELSSSRFARSSAAVAQLKQLKEIHRRRLFSQHCSYALPPPTTAAPFALTDGDSDSERMHEAQAQADREEEEESKHDSSILSGDGATVAGAWLLPQLSLHTEHSGRDSAVTLVRFEETLPSSFAKHQQLTPHAAALTRADAFAPRCCVHPDWSDLQLLEQSLDELVSPEPPLAFVEPQEDERSEASPLPAAVLAASPPMLVQPARRPGCTSPATALTAPHSSFLSCPIRSLELSCGNLFDLHEARTADVVICETKFDEQSYPKLCHLLQGLKAGCRLLTYENIDAVFHRVYGTPSEEALEAKQPDRTGSSSAATGSARPHSPLLPQRSGSTTSSAHKRKRETRHSAVAAAPMDTSPVLQSAPVPISECPVSSLPVAATSGAASSSPSSSSRLPPRHPLNPFVQLPVNLSKNDRFFTTWATNSGHHFYLWEKQF